MIDMFPEITTAVGRYVTHFCLSRFRKIHSVNMSLSTIFIRKPLNYSHSLVQIKEKCKEYSPFLMFILWALSGLYATSKTGVNTNVTGLTLSFAVQDLLIMLLTSTMLHKGLSTKSITLLLPWLGMTFYTLYSNHYLTLVNTITTLKKIKKLSWLPWTNISINVLLLIIRVTLAIRVSQLCVNLWLKRKLDEMKKKTLI